jgi:hypothetical protein
MHRFFFVSINCCLLEPIAIYFSIEVKRVFKENIMFLLFFSKLLQIMIFFSKQIYLWGPYSIGKKPFHPMIRLFFIFLNKLVFGALFHWKKLFQIMIGLFFFFFFSFFFFKTNLSLEALDDRLTRFMVEPTLPRQYTM